MRKSRRCLAFVTHEFLIIIAVVSLIASLIFPLASCFHWHPLLAIAAIFGGYSLFVFGLNFQNLKEDFREWLQKKR